MINNGNEIRKCISSGKTEDALRLLLSEVNDLTEEERNKIALLFGRYNRWKEGALRGVNENDMELRRVESSILEIISGELSIGKSKVGVMVFNNRMIIWIAGFVSLFLVLFFLLYSIFRPRNPTVIADISNVAGRDLTINTQQIIETRLPVRSDTMSNASIEAGKDGVLVVKRRRQFQNKMVASVLEINGEVIGRLNDGGKLTVRLLPGEYILNSKPPTGNYGNDLYIKFIGGDTVVVDLWHMFYLGLPRHKILK